MNSILVIIPIALVFGLICKVAYSAGWCDGYSYLYERDKKKCNHDPTIEWKRRNGKQK